MAQTKTNEESLRALTALKERVKQAQLSAASARAHHDNAKQALKEAEEAAEELGIELEEEAFAATLEERAGEIEDLIIKAEKQLKKAAEAMA